MRDFGQRRWSGQAGSRVHVYALVGDPVRRVAEVVYQPVLQRWRDLLRIVPPEYLHLTLAWLPAPVAAEVTEQQRSALDEALAQRLAVQGQLRLACGPALATSHGVRLDVTPDREITRLAAKIRQAIRDVFGPSAIADPTPGTQTPHIALAYGSTDTDEDRQLAEELREARAPGSAHRPTHAILDIDAVTVVDADTFASDPWRWDNVRTLAFRRAWQSDPAARASWRTEQATYDQRVREFLVQWRAEIDIVRGLDEGDDRPATRVAPRLGPALTAAARRAAFYDHSYARGIRDGSDDFSGADYLTDWRETRAARDTLAAGLAAHLPTLTPHEVDWLADALTGQEPPQP